MASEVKPWRYEIRYGPDGEDSYSWVYDDRGDMIATMKTHKAKEIVDSMNTRPAAAATDTGLVTYAHDNGTLSGLSRNEHGPWCLRSQAEELLAAERAEKERLAALLHDNGTPRFNAVCERAEKAEADNAELTAQIKELEADLKTYQGDTTEEVNEKIDLEFKVVDLEAKLAATEKALEPFAKAALGYDDPDENGPWPDIQDVFVTLGDCRRARAVLGGKPS